MIFIQTTVDERQLRKGSIKLASKVTRWTLDPPPKLYCLQGQCSHQSVRSRPILSLQISWTEPRQPNEEAVKIMGSENRCDKNKGSSGWDKQKKKNNNGDFVSSKIASSHPPLFPGRPERGWPSPGRCTGGSWVPRTGRPCRKPGRRCRGPAERGSPPRRPGGRGKTNRGWKRMGWGRGLTTATPSSVPLQSAPYKNNKKNPRCFEFTILVNGLAKANFYFISFEAVCLY